MVQSEHGEIPLKICEYRELLLPKKQNGPKLRRRLSANLSKEPSGFFYIFSTGFRWKAGPRVYRFSSLRREGLIEYHEEKN